MIFFMFDRFSFIECLFITKLLVNAQLLVYCYNLISVGKHLIDTDVLSQ